MTDSATYLAQQAAEPRVIVNDEVGGKRIPMKESVVQVMHKRRKVSLIRVDPGPTDAYRRGWERIWGHTA